MISASNLDRLAACPVSEHLPHTDNINEWAEQGTAVHEYLCNVNVLGAEAALDEVPDEYRDICEGIDLTRLPVQSGAWSPEVAMIYDVLTDTARVVDAKDRDYGDLTDSEIPGTADVIGLASDHVVVIDYKGKWSQAPLAKINMQMRFYALAACRAFGKTCARVGIARVGHDGTVSWDWATFDGFEIDEIAEEVQGIVESVIDATGLRSVHPDPRPVTGDHCRWCPAYAQCPAQTTLAVALGDGKLPAARTDLIATTPLSDALTPETAAKTWSNIKVARKLLDHIEKTVRTYAAEHPVDLGNGKILGPTRTQRTSIKGDVAHAELKRLHGEEVANAACSFRTSKKAIDDAMKVVVEKSEEKVARAPLVREALLAIEEADGAIVSVKHEVAEHKKPEVDDE